MKRILTLFGLTILSTVNAQSIEWVNQIGGAEDDNGRSIAIDNIGNTYVTGYFNGTVDFDPGVGTFNMTSAGGADIYISKFNTSGDFVWAKQIGGAEEDYGRGIAVDASGNPYVSGTFRGFVDFDPGLGTINLTSAGESDVFVSKFDAFGNFVWAKQLGGNDVDDIRSIALDALGNIYSTGYFR